MPYEEEDESRALLEMQWAQEAVERAEAEAQYAAAQAEAEALAAGGEG